MADLLHQGLVKIGGGVLIACLSVVVHITEACPDIVPRGLGHGDDSRLTLEVTAVTALCHFFLWLLLGGFDLALGLLAGRGVGVFPVPVLFSGVEQRQAVSRFTVVVGVVHILRFKI